MFQPLDGPSKQEKITVTTGTATKVKVGTNNLTGRNVITIQPLTGNIKIYFADDGEVPSAATVTNKGFVHYKNQKDTYEATASQDVFIVSASGSVDVIIAERS